VILTEMAAKSRKAAKKPSVDGHGLLGMPWHLRGGTRAAGSFAFLLGRSGFVFGQPGDLFLMSSEGVNPRFLYSV